jgi:predicted nuclease of predicted toxin-antitoxin system
VKILLDNGLPRSAVSFLVAAGLEAVHVGEIGLASAADQLILDHARAEHFVIVTFDADFHTLLALRGLNAPSVIRIRIEGLKGTEVAAILHRIVGQFGDELLAGAVLSIGPRIARCHLLPLR